MKISNEPCSRIKRYLCYNNSNELSGAIDVIRTTEPKAYFVKRGVLFLNEKLQWTEVAYAFESEQEAMNKIIESKNI